MTNIDFQLQPHLNKLLDHLENIEPSIQQSDWSPLVDIYGQAKKVVENIQAKYKQSLRSTLATNQQELSVCYTLSSYSDSVLTS